MPVLPFLLLALPILASGATIPEGPAKEGLSAEVSALTRSLVEPVYRKANGHGFSTFACDVPRPVPPGGSTTARSSGPSLDTGNVTRTTVAWMSRSTASV